MNARLTVERDDPVAPVYVLTVARMESWHVDAIAELLDGAEPDTHEQAQALRVLRSAIPVRHGDEVRR